MSAENETLSAIFVDPFVNSQGSKYRSLFRCLNEKNVSSERDVFDWVANVKDKPDICLFWNFTDYTHAVLSACRELGINTVFWEDGFFPHYQTLHLRFARFLLEFFGAIATDETVTITAAEIEEIIIVAVG